MIPLRLELEGFFSYKEKQVIDFTRLTDAGLFGIFGTVGSGKSSIPEAMMLALFGEPDRLSMRTDRAGLIHLQSPVLRITFDFESGKEKKIYRSVLEIKRKKKNFGELETTRRHFYVRDDGQWIPLEETSAETILGMSRDDFRRTIIIPQGKFREFVELRPSERSDMLRDLFGLSRFDLQIPAKNLLSEVSDELNFLSGEWASLAHADEEQKEQLLVQRKADEENLVSFGEHLKKLRAEVSGLENVKKQADELAQKQEKRRELQEDENRMTAAREKLQRYMKASVEILPLYRKKTEQENAIARLDQRLQETNKMFHQTQENINVLEQQISETAKEVDKRAERENRILLLKKMIRRNELAFKRGELEEMIREERAAAAQWQKHKDTLQESRKEVLQQIAEKSGMQVQMNVLPELRLSIRDYRMLEETEKKCTEQMVSLEQRKAEILAARKAIEDRMNFRDEASAESETERISAQLRMLEASRREVLKKEGLSAFATLVREGEPCPLCGSVHHPQIAADTHEELKEIEEEWERMQEKRKEYLQAELQYKEYHQERTAIEREWERLNGQREEIRAAIRSVFVRWKEHGWENLQEAEEGVRRLDREKQALDAYSQKLVKLSEQSDDAEREWKKANALLEKANVDLSALGALISDVDEELAATEDQWWKPYLEKEPEEIRSDIDKVSRHLQEVSERYEKLVNERQKGRENISAIRERIETTVREKENLEQEATMLEVQRTEFIRKENWKEEEIRHWLREPIDTTAEQGRLSDYFTQLEVVRRSVEELKMKLGNAVFAPELFSQRKSELETKEREYEEQIGVVEKRKAELAQLTQMLDRKKVLAGKMEELQSRMDGLKELERLFTGRGFVAYIAHFYLKELCVAANRRFMKLTRNRLSLQVDDNNEFFVLDYLNEGKRRSLRTLSGGQTFQASLCLALTLSERVKSISSSERSFFFLDEGFGSLDKDSLAVVLDTIKSLRDEKRVVGLISHVEEMKEEMDVYLEVTLDREHGSQVTLRP